MIEFERIKSVLRRVVFGVGSSFGFGFQRDVKKTERRKRLNSKNGNQNYVVWHC